MLSALLGLLALGGAHAFGLRGEDARLVPPTDPSASEIQTLVTYPEEEPSKVTELY